jgi:uncharacterized protein (TIGR03435 family)
LISTPSPAPAHSRPRWVSLETQAPAAGAKGEDGTALADLSTMFTVFAEMGLKLEPRKAPMETYIIEEVEHPIVN